MKTPSQFGGFVELPDDWTPAQAKAVVDVLNLLLDAVCSKYAEALVEAGREDLVFEQPMTCDDDF